METTVFDIKNAFLILEQLENVSSRNAKLAILRSNINNSALSKLFYCAFNPYLLYQIKKLPKIEPDENSSIISIEKYKDFINILNLLCNREITGNSARELIIGFLMSCNNDEQKWYTRVLFKDLKVGATIETANKVWKNLIPKFKCQLAEPCEGKYPRNYTIERKYDGLRAITKVIDGIPTMFSRNGLVISGYDNMIEEISSLCRECDEDFVLEGEIISVNFNMTVSEVHTHKRDKKGIYYLFDYVPLGYFEHSICNIPLYERRNMLTKFLRRGRTFPFMKHEDSSLVQVVSYGVFDSYSEVDRRKTDQLYDQFLAEGFEGMMIKDPNSFYECKRNRNWTKLKPTETFDITVVDYKEGTGRLEGMLGALICKYKGNYVRAGSGFSDELRDKLWKERDDLIGRIVEVKAQEETENKSGTNSLRFPVFIKFREDKE